MNNNIDELFEEILYGDTYRKVTEQNITDQSRWMTCYSQVFQKMDDNTYWEVTWSHGSTEPQDSGLEIIEITRVVPVEKTITVYEPLKESGDE